MSAVTSLLDAETHKRILEDLPIVLRDAGISEEFIHSSLKTHASAAVVDYVVSWPKHKERGNHGLLVCSPQHMPSPENGMAAVVGALTRNFIRARVVTLQTMMADDDDDLADITCLAVPNLLTGPKSALPDWAIPNLMDKLLVRRIKGRQTLFYAPSFKAVEGAYGMEAARVFKRDFIILE